MGTTVRFAYALALISSAGCADDITGSAETGATTATDPATSSTDAGCVAGSHGCPCTASGECDAGLVCVEDINTCAEQGGPSDADGTTGNDAASDGGTTQGLDDTAGDTTGSVTTGSDTTGSDTTGSDTTVSDATSTDDGETGEGTDSSTGEGSSSSTTGEEKANICNPAGLSLGGVVIDADTTVNAGTYVASAGYFDVALDSTRGRVYLSRGGDGEVEIVDLTGGATTTITTGNIAEHLYFDPARDEVVVTLPVQAHSSFWDEDEQEGCVGTIDAENLSLEPPHWIALDPWDVVTDHAGYAYVVGGSGQWTSGLSLDLETGDHEFHMGFSIRQGTNIDIHPDLDHIYGADNGLSPSDIERYDIDGALMTYEYDSPYHGDYPMCGDLRVHPVGDTIYTACGHVFQSTNVMASDMTWTGDLGMPWDDLAFASTMDLAFLVDETAPVLFIADTTTLEGVGNYALSSPIRRVLAGPDYVVLVRDVLGGAPATELEVVTYDDLLEPGEGSLPLEIDEDVTVNAGTYTAEPGVFDVVYDTERGRVFLSRGQDQEVQILDLTAGSSATLTTPYRAEHMHFDPTLDEIALSLPIADHSPFWFDDEQEGYVAVIDAASLSLSAPHWIPLDPWQLVADGTGVLHTVGASGQWTSGLTVDTSSGWFAFHSGLSIRNGTNIALHPSLDRIYGADNGLSPSDIERYDILESGLDYAYDSPYHGDYPMCGDLRLHPGGGQIYTKCGHVFAATAAAATDMVWADDLGFEWLDLAFDPSGMVVYVLTEDASEVASYDAATLTALATYPLPSAPSRVLAGPAEILVLRPLADSTAVDVIPYADF